MKDEKGLLIPYCTAFLWVGLLVAFLGGYVFRSSLSPDGLVSPVSVKPIYVYPQTLQIYGAGENPKYEKPGDRGAVGGAARQDRPKLPNSNNQRSSQVEEIQRYICSKPWPCKLAKKVAFCESSYRTGIVSKTGDVGLFQIAPVHGYSVSYLSDYRRNTDVAYALYQRQGFQPWYSSRPCHGLR